MSSIFPAVAIGGPPHSGKSVLTYSLTQTLRQALIQHFVVRACPDGEGDVTHETPSNLIRVLRNKGKFSTAFVENVSAALQRRHLPLLVDVGGKPTPEQKQIFQHCTHAIIISSDANAVAEWQETFAHHNLSIIAILDSTLDQPEAIYADGPILRGRISGLERGTWASGPLFERLVWLLAQRRFISLTLAWAGQSPFSPRLPTKQSQTILLGKSAIMLGRHVSSLSLSMMPIWITPN
ncbi:MAG: hypothetical protein R3A44_23055 [Caldilineaceae bacterium]